MRIIKKPLFKSILSIFIITMILFSSAPSSFAHELSDENKKSIDLLFTSDIHSHLKQFKTKANDTDMLIGGLDRMKTVIDEKRSKNINSLLIDGGDFSAGTLYQTILREQASELRMLTELGYDAFTTGNHDFDLGADGYASILNVAAKYDAHPSFVLCNADMSTDNDYTLTMSKAFENYGVTDYVVLNKGNVKIAVTGVFGKNALEDSPTCEMKFFDPIESVKKTVQKIKDNEDVDMIVCLSHSGVTLDNYSTSEDEQLAKAVPELDVILSGHRHLKLDEPIVYDSTNIVSCGCYGMYLGELSLTQNDSGRWSYTNHKLIPITNDIIPDNSISQILDEHLTYANNSYLSTYGLSKEQLIAHNNIDFEGTSMFFSEKNSEYKLGNIISDAFRKQTGADTAFIPVGMIRDTYYKGNITVSDIFNSFSLGMGKDKTYGYPLVKIYLSGEELYTVAEFDASMGNVSPTSRLCSSGFGFNYNSNRMFLNKATDTFIIDDNNNKISIEKGKLYSVVVDLSTCQTINSVIQKSSNNILKIVPKDSNGVAVTDFTDCIVTKNGKEYKAWNAIADYMESFEKNNSGVPEIPESYSELQGRKIVQNDASLYAVLSHPNNIAIIVYITFAVFLIIIFFIVFFIVRFIKRRKTLKNKKDLKI